MLTAAAAIAFGVGGAFRIRPALAHTEKRSLCIALFCLALGALFDISPFYAWFDTRAGVTNLSDLMAHTLGLIGVYFLLLTLNGLTAAFRPRLEAARWLLPVMTFAVAASAVLFFATPMPIETSNFTATYGGEPTIAGYWVISIAVPTMCLVQLLRTSLTHWRSPVVELRVGLRLVALGTVMGFGYATLKFAEVICQAFTEFDLAAIVRPVDLALLGLGLLCIAAGLAATSRAIARQFAVVVRNVEAAYLARRLSWLWRTMCVRAGAAAVLNDRSGGPQFRLLRRVVEIRDAQAVLWASLSPANLATVQSSARIGSALPAPVVLQAAGLTLALTHGLSNGSMDIEAAKQEPVEEVAPSLTRALNPTDEARELIAIGGLVKTALRSRSF